MINYQKEFQKFATKHHKINSMYYDKIVNHTISPLGMTPYILEERRFANGRFFASYDG